MSAAVLPVLADKAAGGVTILRAPKLGLWSAPPRNGARVEPGSVVGTLVQLSRKFLLVIPDGVCGRVELAFPPQDALPVGYADPLFRVVAITNVESAAPPGEAAASGTTGAALTIGAPTDGVYYRSASADAKPYVAVGDRVTTGRPIGLIEVMKTFNPITYGGPGFPDEAEVVEIPAADGQEVRAGQALLVVKKL